MANDTIDSAPLTDAERDEQASQLVDRYSLYSGAGKADLIVRFRRVSLCHTVGFVCLSPVTLL